VAALDDDLLALLAALVAKAAAGSGTSGEEAAEVCGVNENERGESADGCPAEEAAEEASTSGNAGTAPTAAAPAPFVTAERLVSMFVAQHPACTKKAVNAALRDMAVPPRGRSRTWHLKPEAATKFGFLSTLAANEGGAGAEPVKAAKGATKGKSKGAPVSGDTAAATAKRKPLDHSASLPPSPSSKRPLAQSQASQNTIMAAFSRTSSSSSPMKKLKEGPSHNHGQTEEPSSSRISVPECTPQVPQESCTLSPHTPP
jgi:hypothetical protein